MSEELYIGQKEDIDCDITFKQKDGSTIDLSAISTKVYLIVYDGYKNIVAKFKNGGSSTGWFLIDSSTLSTGRLKFKINTTITKNLKPGKYYLEFNARFSSSIHTDDSLFDIIETDIYIFTIKETQINKITSLP